MIHVRSDSRTHLQPPPLRAEVDCLLKSLKPGVAREYRVYFAKRIVTIFTIAYTKSPRKRVAAGQRITLALELDGDEVF